ncbi:hypothetical protein HZF24_15595 [Sedimentibacter hydroxybenzoicus DSM 7310]|uniref:Uncharacterized protein n=1 Tax=Sedimentibacter hydroxybenzoicus DSM 7310 TaxID=1123245 RepID=A0A974BMJ1_SEDHY|nr:hypothetical protein [Sedimentibacter hydroxybenzoicus]NYB75571.1 hypothetical protein [Sedimentibacter hydroxybenzoicus DSM 7310]
MKKIYLFLCITLIAVLTSCSEQTSGENDAVKIWWYKQEEGTIFNIIVEKAIESILFQANLDDIEVDVKQFSYSDISYEDYVLKRNLAIEHGDLDMTFDLPGSLYALRNKAADYDRIESYKNVFDNYKNQYCVPLCTVLRVNFVNNDALIKYNIEPKNVISLDEYYDIKQRMKVNGAEFKLNSQEFMELVDYYSIKNDLKILRDQKGTYIDKTSALTAISELIDDIKSNYEYEYIINDSDDYDYRIIEEKSGYEFSGLMYNYSALNYNDFRGRPPIENYTIVLLDNNGDFFSLYNRVIMPCLFMPSISKNDNAYIIADTLFRDGFQLFLYERGMEGVVTNLDSTRDLIGFDEDWNYVGVKNLTDENGNKVSLKMYPKAEEEKLYEVLTKGYKVVRNMDMSYFFSSVHYYGELREFVSNMAAGIIRNEKTLEDFDKMADDFIVNLNIMGN